MKKRRSNLLPVMGVVCILALTVMIAALCLGGKQTQPAAFVPPEFDPSAVEGVPTEADESWTRVYQDGMNFSAHVCGRVTVNGNSADVFFTNDSGNTVWMKLRIMDESGNILGETGLIRPGEYVQSITFTSVPSSGTAIKMKIMAYEPDTYYSAGAVTLNTVVGG